MNIARVIISKMMREVGHAAYMGKIRNAHTLCSLNLNGRDQLEDLGRDGLTVVGSLG
jgi:hypothetical protein